MFLIFKTYETNIIEYLIIIGTIIKCMVILYFFFHNLNFIRLFIFAAEFFDRNYASLLLFYGELEGNFLL